jgi:hypothetical protein
VASTSIYSSFDYVNTTFKELEHRNRVTVLGGNCLIFQKVAPKISKLKNCQNVYNKAQIESPKYLHQSTFENLKIPTTNHVLRLLI